jgi:hypothetical protein
MLGLNANIINLAKLVDIAGSSLGRFGSVSEDSNNAARRSFNNESGRRNTVSADDPENHPDPDYFALTKPHFPNRCQSCQPHDVSRWC